MMLTSTEKHVEKSATDARQGERRGIWKILAISTGIALLGIVSVALIS